MNEYLKNKALFTLFFCSFFGVYYKLFCTIPNHSDDASILLQAKSFLEGNVFMKGWHVPPDSFWTIDILIHSCFMAIFGFTPNLMNIVPAFIYSGIVICTLILVKNKRTWKESALGLLITLVITALPSMRMIGLISHSPIHLGTILFVLIALVLFNDLHTGKRLKITIIIVLFLLSAIGDPYAIYVFFVPFILVHVFFMFRKKDKQEHLFWIIATVSAIVVSKIVLMLVTKIGGFFVHPENSVFASLDILSHNIKLTISGILDLYGSNFFGNPLKSIESLESVMRISLIGVVIFSCIKAIHLWRLNKHNTMSMFLLSSIVVTILAYSLSTQPTDSYSSRFLFPVVIFGAILAGKYISLSFNRRFIVGSVTILFISSMMFFTVRLNAPIPNNPTEELEIFLKDKNLKTGYGEFWTSSIVTVESNLQVRLRPVASDKIKIVPIDWLSDDSWYNEPANFLVFDDKGTLSYETAVNVFGPEDEKYQVGHYTVLIWNKNIAIGSTNS